MGVDVVFYGKVFRLCDSDKFTKDFLESEGIAVNPAEPVAEDPYNQVDLDSRIIIDFPSFMFYCQPRL